ncbi:TRAP transporter substrate-binding protein [Notoacmeibacter sp. MSK16QG-6]|uniref:TRAP transporter substrate-binding protein n=1 Tax=Notoacmeibacter sp. MSK16QG-6 TaxID=2957982 RepID=UPI0020A065A2|nr:TRAP transporter substrate-binding protein [Notoacmeibacter sp. MSK16QG-6]MCP1199575.1 TRAP transporter substrate-binding protein [Notoacmeibacter sp. MSK16QG-6]
MFHFSRLRHAAQIAAAALLMSAASASAQDMLLTAVDPTGSLNDNMNLKFIEELGSRNESIKVNYVNGGALGSGQQILDQLSQGNVQGFGTVLDWFSALEPDLQALSWGFTFRDADHMRQFLASPLFEEMKEKIVDKANIRILTVAPTQARVMFAKEPIMSVDDVKGIKMRVPGIKSYVELWRAFGTEPTQVAWGEVYLALKTGVVDAAEGQPTNGAANRMHESGPHISMTNHVMTGNVIAVNETFWQSLDDKGRADVMEAAEAAVNHAADESDEQLQATLQMIKDSGGEIHEPDVESFRKASLEAVPAIESEGLWRKGLIQEIQDLK